MLSNVERKNKTESSGRNEDGEERKKRMKESWFYSLPQPSSSSVEDGRVGGGLTARGSSPSTPSCSPGRLAAASDQCTLSDFLLYTKSIVSLLMPLLTTI